MRIGVNTRLFVKGKMDGIAWFSYEILKRIVTQHPEHEFVFFFDRSYDPYFIFAPNVKPVIVRPQARHPLLWFLFFEIGIKKALTRERIDLFISTDGWVCLGTDVKTINVIHDLNFEHYPSFFSPLVRKYLTYFFPRFAKKTDHLITVSEFSKKDIVNLYHIDKENIDVVFNAASDDFFEVDEKTKKQTVQRLTDGVPYFVFVGSAHKRKNVERIMQAFDQFREKHANFKFVFAGSNKYWDEDIKRTYNQLKHKSDIVFTGYISTEEMNRVLSSALVLVYPSLFEGFGVPILEGFAARVPVITSNTTSMPEVAGDAAVLVNPLSIEEIVNAMEKIAMDEQLRAKLIQLGKERNRAFSWDKSAQKFWDVIMKFCK
ncbi:MAG: glycosyltransferase family 4 protein [Bacteroidetes bacterium]|nr:glycosyltransferase family 4 protein [Bacteroidota bacterium]MCL2302565.1 glycosyltransferase family 4 protein [Lentimicrobiaceae bacterium]